MKNDNSRVFDDLKKEYQDFRDELPRKVGVTAVNFFKRNFTLGGFADKPFKRWKGKQNPRGRKLMVQSGTLRRGIKTLRTSRNKVVVGVGKHIQYAKLHNEGGKVAVTPKSRRFFWAMYLKTGNAYYKNLALTKKTHFDIPQRQFIGDSKALEINLERMIIKELKKALGGRL